MTSSDPEPNFVMMDADEPPKSAEQLRRQALRLLQQGGDEAERDEFLRRAREYAGPQAPAAPAAPAPTRAMIFGAATVPAVFIVVVMAALALFGKPADRAGETDDTAPIASLEQPAATPATGASFASARPRPIALGEDMRIADISLDGDRVALHVESPMGQQILIYDYAKGRVIAEAPIETASIEAVDALAMLTGAPPPATPAAAIAPPPIADPAANVPARPQPPSMKPRRRD